jgi:predicted CoA-substrate-specific enzyme activase
LDIGSVSLNTVLVDADRSILYESYTRLHGQPLQTVLRTLSELLRDIPKERIAGLATTGTGGELLAQIMGGVAVNEIVAHTTAIAHLHPRVRTIIEMGGEDSKLIILSPGDDGRPVLEDFAMNTQCAAGTGSFLDQQASRMGVSVEGSFSELALKSEKPPRIAGRCSVFAKSDMIHLQQIGTPDYDILAGLCYAVARTFKSNIGRGKKFIKPIAFQGGVAANKAVVKAFEDVLDLVPGELVIPELFASMGALGSVYTIIDNGCAPGAFLGLEELEAYLRLPKEAGRDLEPLGRVEELGTGCIDVRQVPTKMVVDAYIGIDVGSLSTNVVIIDADKRVLARRYLPTAGRPLQAVAKGLKEVGEEVGHAVRVQGVGTTGSGRYLTGDFVGADVVRNEITAQARAAIYFHPEVDTVFEIGGQDSKYISIDRGVVVDFEMNKVCAAGTGSFLEEQAEKLDMSIKEEFGQRALEAECPSRLGDRCTVFMESDLVAHQQKGAAKDSLVAGLAYSIVHNYLNRVVEDRRVGDNILFQGGVAWNRGVVSAFEAVTGKTITVPPHHDVTGAIGTAILALEADVEESNFHGFDLSSRTYTSKSFECKACDNLCEIRHVSFEDEASLYYGARCERWDVKKGERPGAKLPDLFAERNERLFASYVEPSLEEGRGRRIGLPRILHAYEWFPYWQAFFKSLGYTVVLSDTTNRSMINTSIEREVAETCFPVKIVHGHVLSLMDKEVDYIFLPSFINAERDDAGLEQNYFCPLVQATPQIIKAALEELKDGPQMLVPVLFFQRGKEAVERELAQALRPLGVSRKAVTRAILVAIAAQEEFRGWLSRRGAEVFSELDRDGRALVVLSRPYNGCDQGINLSLPKKLKDLGALAIPMDFLPLQTINLAEELPNMFWRYGQRIIQAAKIIASEPGLHAVYLTNFKCGPDSFIDHFVRDVLRDKPYLTLEIDEHSADAGAITRCEAYLDSLSNHRGTIKEVPLLDGKRRIDGKGHERTLYIPNMTDHASVMAAAFRYSGVKAEVLPEPDIKALEIGKQFASGRECLPFAITTGEMVKKAMEPGFDPDRSAFLMPGTDGPCRFGQYVPLQQRFLERIGIPDIPIIGPDAQDSYDAFQGVELGSRFQRLTWKGVVGVDLLEKLVRETRPYELQDGQSDAAFAESLQDLVEEVEAGCPDMVGRLKKIRDRFRAIPADRSHRRPIIGIVGEIYLRTNRFSNNNLVRQVEAVGGEAWVASLAEWIFYTNYTYKETSKADGNWRGYLRVSIKDLVQKWDEKTFSTVFKDVLLGWHDESTKEILNRSDPYLTREISGEAILSLGKSLEYIEHGLSGIINVMPFTCMPGMMVTAIMKSLREHHDDFPFLSFSYDGQQDVNALSRLEAFIYQAAKFKERRASVRV